MTLFNFTHLVATIAECLKALELFKRIVEPLRIQLKVQNARNAKRAEGSLLEYGLKYHLEIMNKELAKGIPSDPRFPERDNQWIQERANEYNLLIKWFEDFKSKFGIYPEAQNTISECVAAMNLYSSYVNSEREER